MFDTFDVIVPSVLPLPGLAIRQDETAFGADETRYLYVGDIRLAKVVLASVAFENVAAWTGSASRSGWTVLLLREEANAAAGNDAAWQPFLEALRAILEGHPQWRVTCESDCEQHPLERLALGPEALIARLDSDRSTKYFPIAFYAETPVSLEEARTP